MCSSRGSGVWHRTELLAEMSMVVLAGPSMFACLPAAAASLAVDPTLFESRAGLRVLQVCTPLLLTDATCC